MADVTIPAYEWEFLMSLKGLTEYNRVTRWHVAWNGNWQLQGSGLVYHTPNFDILTDEQLVKMAAEVVSPMALGHIPYGRAQDYIEEDVTGKIPMVDYPYGDTHADLSPGGPASLVGKICLELARRLRGEISGDRRARAYGGWEAADDPPAQD